jgi:hypothetical protein
MDNMLYALNKLQDKMTQVASASSKKGGDAVDDLF